MFNKPSPFAVQSGTASQIAATSGNTRTFWVFVILSLLLCNAPFFNILFSPINTFVTMIHEMGHALACLTTGGSVSGLTIVSDGAGHGGLTFCHGGNAFIFTQAGYLGTAFFGCILVTLGQFPRLSKIILTLMGTAMAMAGICLETRALLQPGFFLQALLSIAWSLLLGVGLIWAGIKWPQSKANLLLLFLAVQTALNSLSDVGLLIQVSMGAALPNVFSDATNMQAVTGIPAPFWSLWWGLLSILMLGVTLRFTYGRIFFGKQTR